MKVLVVKELRAGADPEWAHDLLVKIAHETTLQSEQEVLHFIADREQTPPALSTLNLPLMHHNPPLPNLTFVPSHTHTLVPTELLTSLMRESLMMNKSLLTSIAKKKR